MGWCYYLMNKILDLCFGNTSYTPGTYIYLGLAQSITAAGAITGEPPANAAYARVNIAANTVIFNAAASGTKACPNGVNWTFPQANASWGTVNVFFFSDVATLWNNTNTLAWGQLNVNKTIGSGDTPYFASGDITLNIT